MAVARSPGVRGRVGGRRSAWAAAGKALVRRQLPAVVLAVVVPVALVFSGAGVAGAAAITNGTPDGSGNYADCNLNYQSVASSAWLSSNNMDDVNPLTGVSDAAAAPYWDAYAGVAYCNTAYGNQTSGGSGSWGVSIWHNAGSGGATIGGGGGGYGSSLYQFPVAPGSGTGSHFDGTSATDGHFVESSQSGTTVPSDSTGGYWFCVDVSFFSTSAYSSQSTGEKASLANDECGSAWACASWQNSSSYTAPVVGKYPCAITSTLETGTLTTPAEPGTYWGSQTAVLPTVSAPVVSCSSTVNPVTGVAELVATSSAVTGGTVAYSWSYGDGTTNGTALAESHTYTATMPAGGFQAMFTATATGDGTTTSGTAAGSCTTTVDLATAGAGGGGASPSTSEGGTAPPTSCGWFDVACMFEQAVAWLVVPGPTFFADWSSFEATLKSAVPFCYIVEAVTYGSTLESSMSTDITTYGADPTCYSVQINASSSYCAALPTGWATVIRAAVGIMILSSAALGVYGVVRRAVAAH